MCIHHRRRITVWRYHRPADSQQCCYRHDSSQTNTAQPGAHHRCTGSSGWPPAHGKRMLVSLLLHTLKQYLNPSQTNDVIVFNYVIVFEQFLTVHCVMLFSINCHTPGAQPVRRNVSSSERLTTIFRHVGNVFWNSSLIVVGSSSNQSCQALGIFWLTHLC